MQYFASSKSEARHQFQSLYWDKTGNSWDTRKEDFVKRPNKFYPLEIDYSTGDDASQLTLAPGSKSKLAPEIQDLIRMIFDVESMKKVMLEFEVRNDL